MQKRSILKIFFVVLCLMGMLPLAAVTPDNFDESMTLIIKPRGNMVFGVSLTLPAVIEDTEAAGEGFLDEYYEEPDGMIRVSGTFYPFIYTLEPRYEVKMFAGPIKFSGETSGTPSPSSLPTYSITIGDNVALINGQEKYTNIEGLDESMYPVTILRGTQYSDVIITSKPEDQNKWKEMRIDMYLSMADNHIFDGAQFTGSLKLEVTVFN